MISHYKGFCVYILPWTPRVATHGWHVERTKMPTQSKKSVSVTPTERSAKPKKKKKKESGRNSRHSASKTPASGADSSCEGLLDQCCLFILTLKRKIIKLNVLIWNSHLPRAKLKPIFSRHLGWLLSFAVGTHRKSRTKTRTDTYTNIDKKIESSKSCSSSTQDTSSSSWRTSSSDGRSTSSSGENFGATSCTNSASSDDARARESAVNTSAVTMSRLTRINETLRWDFTQSDDPDEEEERLRIYKLHRRKRYMDFLHKRTGGEPQTSFYA